MESFNSFIIGFFIGAILLSVMWTNFVVKELEKSLLSGFIENKGKVYKVIEVTDKLLDKEE